MSVARITTINFKNKEDADESIRDYSEKAPSEFPEAEQLLQWNEHQLQDLKG